jgi:hypothetical protein
VPGPLGGRDVTRFWLINRDVVVPLDSAKFPIDGTYNLELRAWKRTVTGT